MGTRADFYIGRGDKAEWLGSIAWDGYPAGIAGHRNGTSAGDVKKSPILTAKTPRAFRKAVADELASRDDATTPDMGWPWPWTTSSTTDYAYAFDKGKVWASGFGHSWFNPLRKEPDDSARPKTVVFPDMSSVQNVDLGGRSGLIIVQAK
jgi:hypothetical protein